MLIEFHILKNYPPTNLNRDETGTPKSCFFGGSQRGRISSQCLKSTWRRSDNFKKLNLGIRTRYLPDLIAMELAKRGIAAEYIEAAKKKITGFGNKESKESDDMRTTQIMTFSSEDVLSITNVVEASIKEVKSIKDFEKIRVKQWKDRMKDIKIRPITLDIALFGRMITDDSFANVEASMQVAHAISTNEVNAESDFFTAVDDLKNQFSTDIGSAMMGDTDFNSCCYYIYASLDTDQLFDNLKNSPDALKIAKTILPILIETMVFSNPSGKQNSFAGNVYPGLVCVECKIKKIPISYVNAFEIPAKGNYGQGLTKQSAEMLVQEIDKFDKKFKIEGTERLWFAHTACSKPENAVQVDSLGELLQKCEAIFSN